MVWRKTTGDSLLDVDQDNGAVAYLDDGTYHLLEDPTRTWPDPATVFIPASVIDANGDGRNEVVLKSLVGANTDHFALLTVTPDARLHAVRFPGGAVGYVNGGGGAGGGSGFGCATSQGRKLLVQTLWSSDSRFEPYGSAYQFEVIVYELDGAALKEVRTAEAFRSDGRAGSSPAVSGRTGAPGRYPSSAPCDETEKRVLARMSTRSSVT